MVARGHCCGNLLAAAAAIVGAYKPEPTNTKTLRVAAAAASRVALERNRLARSNPFKLVSVANQNCLVTLL
jgi:hypothetical protein